MKDWTKDFTTSELKTLQERYEKKVERTKVRGLAFTLTLEDWFMMGKKLLGMQTCDYTDMPFNMASVHGEKNPRYPTVERINDRKGYVRGNVCVVMRRANELKDKLVDKLTAITIIDDLDREIVQAMMLNMSKDHMEKLKTKYIPQQEEPKMNEETTLPRTTTLEEATVEVQEATPEVVPVPALPEDVVVAIAYSRYCTDFANAGMNVTVSYAQFKAKYVRKVCALTGEELVKEPKAILILDLSVGFAKDNFIIVSNKMANALTQLMISTGLSLPKVTAMLNKVM